MAKADIGPKIGIEGEAEFKRQIQDITTGLKTLGTEMDVVTSSFAANEDSVEALTAKNDVLDRTILTLNEKLEKQQEMLQKSAEAYGEADKRTQYWQQQVNKTTTEINKASNAYEANSKQLGKLGKTGEGVGGILKSSFGSLSESLTGKLGSALGLSTSQMKSLTSAISSGSSAMGGLSASSLAAAGAVAAVGAAAVKGVAELVKLSEEAGKSADAVNTMATKYGLTTGEVQKLQYMAQLTDTSVETITGSMAKLTRSMESARDGTGSAAEAFRTLGVNVEDSNGSLRDNSEVFYQIVDALGAIGNETERDALSMAIFGKSAMELNPLLAAGSDTMRAYAAEAENIGYVMSDQMLTSLQAVDDAGVRLDNSMTALKNTLGAAVAPTVATVKDGIADLIGAIANGIQELAGMRDEADNTAEAFNNLSSSIQGVKDLTAEDLLTDQQRSYKDYVSRALKYQQETGQAVTIYRQDVLSNAQGYYQGQYNNGSVTINLDGYTVGKAVTPRVNGQNYSTGNVL